MYQSKPHCTSFHLENSHAFTLLEVMIAVSIMSIALVALFGSQSRSLSHATEAQFNNIAPMLAAIKLAELEGGLIFPTSDDGEFGEDFPGYTWRMEVEDAIFAGPEALAKLSEPIQRVLLTVEWSEAAYNYTLAYYGRWYE